MMYDDKTPPKSETAIIDAIETLSSIAELELEGPIAVAEEHQFLFQEVPVIYHTVHWLHKKNAEKVMRVVRDTFKIVLNYLRDYYKHEVGKLTFHDSVEGIKTIMVLVGEAAKKLDRYSKLFVGANAPSIKQTPEFRELFSFYNRKIAPIEVQESLSKFIHLLPMKAVIDLSKKRMPAATRKETEHLFLDLDSAKKDSDYDLFFIRKDDGSRFFAPRLLRNMKLVCNFEDALESDLGPIRSTDQLDLAREHYAKMIAKGVSQTLWHRFNAFAAKAREKMDNELISTTYKMMIALIYATSQKEGEPAVIIKGAARYFLDFQKFYRAILASYDFQKLITYPPEADTLESDVVAIMKEVSDAIYRASNNDIDLKDFLILMENNSTITPTNIPNEFERLSSRLRFDYELYANGLSVYGHAPLVRDLEALQDVDIIGFDPWMLLNLPTKMFEIHLGNRPCAVMRYACPTIQDYVQKAHVIDEFKEFMRGNKGVHLIFNMQDPTSWREYARCKALSHFQRKEDFHHAMKIATISCDSDFYHQIGPYEEINQAEQFLEHLHEHILSEQSGYLFPEDVKKQLFPDFIKGLSRAIHELMFSGRNVLTRSDRLDFITLYYALLELKIIEVVNPDSIAFSCKDGLDVSIPKAIELYLLLKILNRRPISEHDRIALRQYLFALIPVIRGRSISLERFERMISAINKLEGTIDEQPNLHQLIQERKLFHPETLERLTTIFSA